MKLLRLPLKRKWFVRDCLGDIAALFSRVTAKRVIVAW